MGRTVIALSLFLAMLAAGCEKSPPPVASAGPLVIPVSHPVKRKVTDYVDYTGRTAAENAVDVRPRVTGYLVKIPFKEGAEVKKGDLLFEIDPGPYEANVAQAKAQVQVNEARVRLAKANYERARTAASGEAISRQQLDVSRATELEAEANLKAAQATLKNAELFLGYTRITSPIDGHISRYYLTLGNLVNANQTLLTTIVSVDPIYAFFDMDERTILRIRTLINTGKIQPAKNTTDIPVLLGLEGEEDRKPEKGTQGMVGYPHVGMLNFVNNTVNWQTGTLAVRAVFPNPKPPNGRRLMTPGMFVRIRLPIGQPKPALLVIDRAIGFDQALKFVYVVDGDNKLQTRRVTTGPLLEDGLRVIESGLKEDDWVVVGSLQQLHARMTIDPEQMPMPTIAPSTATK